MGTESFDALRDRSRGISAGLFAAPLGNLDAAVGMIASWGGGIVHFDVMDGVFVPQITAGPGFVAAAGSDLVRDVHLMVERPEKHVEVFAKAGADIITVHAEVPTSAHALAAVRAASLAMGRPILAGLGIMPGTPLDSLAPLLDPAPDLILVLAVDPRTDAAPDLAAAGARLRVLADKVLPARPLMAIDGGVSEATITTAAASAPDMIVSGSALFRAPDPRAAYRHLAGAWAETAAGPELEDHR